MRSNAHPRAERLQRLRALEEQVREIHRMVEERRPCTEILEQITAAREALREVGLSLLRSHLDECAAVPSLQESSHPLEQFFAVVHRLNR